MGRSAPLRRLTAVAIAAAVAGCSTTGPLSSGRASPSDGSSVRPTVDAASPASDPPSAAPASPSGSTQPSPPPPAADVGTATAGFLASDSARFELTATRHRPNLPAEVTAIGSGIVDPAGDRGRMRYELFPNDADDSAFAEKPLEIAWTATDYWVRAAQDDSDRAWQHTTRARAPEQMNLIGRVNEEPVALLRMAAAATPADVRAGASAELDGRPAERWLVSVPAEVASDNFVPPDTYLGFSQIFGRSDLPLEVWLVAGTVVRIGYVLEREKAPYGGPDRLETWYDWSGIGGPIELEVPPPGEIEDVGAG